MLLGNFFLIFTFAAKPLQPCQQSIITPETSYISSRQTREGGCQSRGHIGGTQFYLNCKEGQRIKLSTLSITTGTTRNLTGQVGYVVDEGDSKVFPIEVITGREEPRSFMVSTSSEVTVTLHAADSHFLILAQGICPLINQTESCLR